MIKKMAFSPRTYFLRILLGIIFLSKPMYGSMETGIYGWLDKKHEGSFSSKTSTTSLNLCIQPMLYLTPNFIAGGKLVYDLRIDANPTNQLKTSFMSVGPSIGYVPLAGGLSVSAAYLMYPTKTVKITDETVRYGGSGYSLDFGYKIPVGTLTIGPVLTINSVSYKKETSKVYTQELPPGTSESWIQGYFAVWAKI